MPSNANSQWVDLANTQAGNTRSLGLTPMPNIGGPSSGIGARLGWSVEVSFKVSSQNQWSKILSLGIVAPAQATIVLGFHDITYSITFQVFGLNGQNTEIWVGDNWPLNVWSHVVLTMQPGTGGTTGTQVSYVNGTVTDVNTGTYYPDNTGRTQALLMASTWGDKCFDGYVDALRVYDYVLSPGEIQSLATLSLTGTAIPPVQTSPEAAVHRTVPHESEGDV